MPEASQPAGSGSRPSNVALPLAVVVIVLVVIALAATLLQGRGKTGRVSNGWIAYAAAPSEPSERTHGIYLVGSGLPARRIIGSDGDRIRRGCPRFSPDGTKLAYGEGRDLGVLAADRAVVVVSIDSAGEVGRAVRIPVGGADRVTCPSWSADGRSLAFVSERGAIEIHEVDAGVDVIPARGGAEIRDLQWSPAERSLAVARSDGLWVFPRDGQPELVRPGNFHSVRWSPDGKRLAATEPLPGAGPPSWLHLASGTVWLIWLDDRSEDVELEVTARPSWSALGDLVVLAQAEFNGEIRGVNKVTRTDGSEGLVDDGDGYRTSGALWSPDGSWLLRIVRSRAEETEVLVATPAIGGKSIRLANVPGHGFPEDDLAWQPIRE